MYAGELGSDLFVAPTSTLALTTIATGVDLADQFNGGVLRFAQRLSVILSSNGAEIFTLVSLGLPNGVLGYAYSEDLLVVGGAAPYEYVVISGALPDGLSLGLTTGTISGTPTESGSTTFTVQATDSNGLPTSRAFTLTIDLTQSGSGSAGVSGWIA
jgi:large repetitive protein